MSGCLFHFLQRPSSRYEKQPPVPDPQCGEQQWIRNNAAWTSSPAFSALASNINADVNLTPAMMVPASEQSRCPCLRYVKRAEPWRLVGGEHLVLLVSACLWSSQKPTIRTELQLASYNHGTVPPMPRRAPRRRMVAGEPADPSEWPMREPNL
jgi:hypothetical protein